MAQFTMAESCNQDQNASVNQPRMAQRSGYIDQWRGLSVLAVIANHLVLFRSNGWLISGHSHLVHAITNRISLWGVNEGMVGVDIFFVISGYLITKLLVREEQQTGRISLKAFYVRRCTRIMPAMFAYIAAVAILALVGLTTMTSLAPLKAASYLCNTRWVECPDQYNTLWSIGVEEQFYLIWPLLLILAGTLRSKFVAVAILVGAICSVIPQLQVRGWINNGLATYCLSCGVLFALSARFRSLFEPLRKVPTAVLGVLLLVGVSYTITRWATTRPFMLLLLPPLIVATVLARDGRVAGTRISEGLRQIGLVSYSLYLWHGIAMWTPGASDTFRALSFLAIPFAWVSYWWIEQPFVRIGHRWSKSIIAAGTSNAGASMQVQEHP